MSTLAASRPATTAPRAFSAVAAPLDVSAGLSASLEATVQRSRRLAIAAERRRHRLAAVVSGIAVGLGSAGTLAFAALMVATR